MRRRYYVYIMSNRYHTCFYTGVTNSLIRRMSEHRNEINEGFTKKYKIKKLLYYEVFDRPMRAINREKQIKKYRREKKLELIRSVNPKWENLL